MRHNFEPITVGDFVRFAWLPRDCQPTPIRVEGVAPNGMLLLAGHGWYQPHLLKRTAEFPSLFSKRHRARQRGRKKAAHQQQWDDWQKKHPPAQKSLFGEAA